MKGFRNAPHITEFAVGMRVYLHGKNTGIIMALEPHGAATLFVRPVTLVMDQVTMRHYELDLTSLWVGREFVEKDSRERAVVTASPEFTHMGFVHVACSDGIRDFLVENFWVDFEPVEKG